MERTWTMQTHLEMHEIFRLAMAGEHHSHLDSCAFCRTEYDDAVELLKFEAPASSEAINAEGVWLTGHHQYRLAAQDSDGTIPETHVRRTWYLENGSAVLRVMEDSERRMLYGHLITDPTRYTTVVIRFDGIEGDFRPDQSGIFEIGSVDTEIEKMDAILIGG